MITKVQVSDKRTAILQTTLDLISDRGFHNTPMSLIAKEAGVSTGTIYHYFAGKDELIFELYREIKLDLFRIISVGVTKQPSLREGFLQLWNNYVHYYIQHPRETAFLEQFENSPYSKPDHQEIFAEEIAQYVKFVKGGIEEGLVKNLPFEIIIELTFGVAVSLAKQHIAGTVILNEELLQTTADACWDAIAA